ncbi:hypothetical protein FRC06_010678, partial [Ceratobasidium sp. 370]
SLHPSPTSDLSAVLIWAAQQLSCMTGQGASSSCGASQPEAVYDAVAKVLDRFHSNPSATPAPRVWAQRPLELRHTDPVEDNSEVLEAEAALALSKRVVSPSHRRTTTTMPPSKKRQSTPPVSSLPALPTLPSRDGSPSPGEPHSAAEWWASDILDKLELMCQPLNEKEHPLRADKPAFVTACTEVRGYLKQALDAVEYQLYLAEVDFALDREVQTEEPVETPLAAPCLATAPLPPPSAPEGVPPNPVPRSYAQAAKKTPATLTPKVGPVGCSQLASAPIPARIIVRPLSTDGRPPAAYFSPLLEKGPTEPYRRLSHALALSPVTKKVMLLGVHQNRKGNLIVTLAPGTSDADVTRVYPVIKNVLATGGIPPVLQRDIPWSKLLVSN